ncbi:hypothetical protein GS426_08295 [Rhodococcus hoagii]|nr:hypothetical protein [Prescottella equi]
MRGWGAGVGVGDGADPVLSDQDGLGAVVRLREENRATRPLFDAVVNMHLDMPTRAELDGLAARHGTTRAEIMRIAVDRFPARARRAAACGYAVRHRDRGQRGDFQRDREPERLIARRQRREAARQATS